MFAILEASFSLPRVRQLEQDLPDALLRQLGHHPGGGGGVGAPAGDGQVLLVPDLKKKKEKSG